MQNALDNGRERWLAADALIFDEALTASTELTGLRGLARAMGVAGKRVERPDQILQAMQPMLADDQAFLLELITNLDVPDHFVYHKAGQ